MMSILLLILFVSFSALAQKIDTTNGWEFIGIFSSWTDSVKTKSFINSEGQVFGSYGSTMFFSKVWTIQTTWSKRFIPTLSIPDTVSVDCKFINGEVGKIVRLNIRLGVQDSAGNYALLVNNLIPLDSIWRTFSWSMTSVKGYGIGPFARIYLAFQFISNDSCLTGGDIAVRNLNRISGGEVRNIDFSVATAVSEPGRVPQEFILEQNYPNPFNPSTTIRFNIPEKGYVNLTVFNSLGQVVQQLVSEEKSQGNFEVVFNASNLSSGLYLYRLQSASSVETKKMVLLK